MNNRIGIAIGTINTPLSSFDSNALAYITNAGITNPTQQVAINDFVLALKSSGMWNNLYAFYPLMGSTLSANSYNLINVSQYQINWVGSPTVSSGGITFNGTTQYGDTGFSPIAVSGFSEGNVTLGCWDATGFNSRTEAPMGATENVGSERIRAIWFNTNNNLTDIWSQNNSAGRIVFTPQAIGHWMFGRRSASDTYTYWYQTNSSGASGTWINSATIALTPIPTNKIFLGATSDGSPGVNTPVLYSSKYYKFFYIAKSISTGSQLNGFVNNVYTFMTATGK